MALPKSMRASDPDAVAANATGLADAHAAAPQSGTDAADDPASGVNILRSSNLCP